MNYCPFDIERANISLGKKIKEFNLTPLPVYFLKYITYTQAKENLLEIINKKNQQNYNNFAIFIEIEKIDQQTQQFINNLHKEFSIIFVQGGLNKINRFILESTSADVLVDPHTSKYKIKTDFIHHFNSGINHILATFAKEKETIFMINLNSFIQKKKNLSKDIGRISQNIKLCRKYNIPIFLNYIVYKQSQIKTYAELSNILHLLGGSKEQSSNMFSSFEKKVEENNMLNSKNTITKGLYIKNC